MSTRAEPAASEEIAWYQPVLNLAAHYRWDLGLRLPSAAGFSGPAEGVQFVIAPTAIVGAAAGAVIGATTSRDKVKGAVIGGVIGGVLGGVIGNNVDVQKTRKPPV